MQAPNDTLQTYLLACSINDVIEMHASILAVIWKLTCDAADALGNASNICFAFSFLVSHAAFCVNCKGPHAADDFKSKCPFVRAKYDREEIKALYRKARNSRTTRSPLPNTQPAV